jgi:tetratricopeptide (TPR) repeat protein
MIEDNTDIESLGLDNSTDTNVFDKKGYIKEGNTYFKAKDYDSAKKLYENAILANNPHHKLTDYEAYVGLGNALCGLATESKDKKVKTRKYTEAITAYKKAEEVDLGEKKINATGKMNSNDNKALYEAHIALGDISYQLSDYTDAIKQYKSAKEIDKKNINSKNNAAHIGLGNIYFAKPPKSVHEREDNLFLALEEYYQAIKINSNNDAGWENIKNNNDEVCVSLANTLTKIGLSLARSRNNSSKHYFEASAKVHQDIITIDPNSVLAHCGYGDSLSVLFLHDKAKEQYKKALEIDPQHELAKDRQKSGGVSNSYGMGDFIPRVIDKPVVIPRLEEVTRILELRKEEVKVEQLHCFHYLLSDVDKIISEPSLSPSTKDCTNLLIESYDRKASTCNII